jgi:hypothetical protein
MVDTLRNVNIGRCHADDPFYRYKMPCVAIKQRAAATGPSRYS